MITNISLKNFRGFDREISVRFRPITNYQPLVDSTKKIRNEYQQMVIPIIRNMDETRPQLPLLRHWMLPETRRQVMLNQNDSLMQQIKGVIHEADEHADRAFVYVACSEDSTLVTNDGEHILGRRRELLRRTKRFRGRNTTIQSSSVAADRFCGDGGQAQCPERQ